MSTALLLVEKEQDVSLTSGIGSHSVDFLQQLLKHTLALRKTWKTSWGYVPKKEILRMEAASSPSRVYCICEEDETEREKPFFFFTYSSFMLSQSWQPCAVWKMLRVSYICCEGMWPNFDTMCWWFETYKEETPRLLLDIVHLSRTPQKATDVKMPESRESRVWDSIEAARKADHVLLIVLLKWGQDSRNKSSRT